MGVFDEMTRSQLEHLLYGMWLGDGFKTAGTYAYDIYSPKTVNIATARGHVADRLQALCVRRGVRCVISTHNKPNDAPLYIIRVSPGKTLWNIVGGWKKTDNRPKWGPLPADPNEEVWCVQVPSGAMVVRRNGKAFVTGNCLGRTHREGQEADEVSFQIITAIPEQLDSFNRARGDARAIEELTGQPQKLCYGDVVITEFGASEQVKRRSSERGDWRERREDQIAGDGGFGR